MSDIQGKTWNSKILNRVFRYALPYQGLLVSIIVLVLLLSYAAPLRVNWIGDLITDFIANDDRAGLLKWTLIIIGMLLLETTFSFFESYLTSVLGQRVIKDLRKDLFNHIIKLRLKYFDNHPIGMLVTRVVSDMDTIAQIFTQGIFAIFSDILKLIMALAMMLYIDWRLTLLVIIPVPLLVIATSIFKKAIKKAFTEVRQQVSVLNTFVQERITGMYLVKVFGREEREAKKFAEINDKHRRAHIKSIWAYSIFFPVVEILSALSQGLLALYILYQAAYGDQNFANLAGDLTMFILYIGMFYRPIRMLADKFNTLQMGLVGAERVFRVLDTDETVINTGDLSNISFKGDILFKDVFFAYNDDEYVLKDLNLDIKAGETVAFVGATGAGKTSIINLLGRFYEFQKGSITIDEYNIRDLSITEIRKNIGIVLQDVFLYSDTIFNNITLGTEHITKEDVIEAAKVVGAHDFISQLPNDYDFDVKERGGLLSVGQRQLISFIRAYVHNPKILILDEATSSIDSNSEQLIQKATEIITKGRTSIIIAHRLSTIRDADKIVVLDKGEIKEVGSHENLMTIENGWYRKLYDSQLQKD